LLSELPVDGKMIARALVSVSQSHLQLTRGQGSGGDIKASKLVVDEGAQFDGKCAMSGEAKPMPNLVELKPEAKR